MSTLSSMSSFPFMGVSGAIIMLPSKSQGSKISYSRRAEPSFLKMKERVLESDKPAGPKSRVSDG
jgi:hypothetical protein